MRRNARAGCFSLYLDFLFELNEVCTQACEEEEEEGGAGVARDGTQQKGHTSSSYSKCSFQQL